jgi:hypothetical protein
MLQRSARAIDDRDASTLANGAHSLTDGMTKAPMLKTGAMELCSCVGPRLARRAACTPRVSSRGRTLPSLVQCRASAHDPPGRHPGRNLLPSTAGLSSAALRAATSLATRIALRQAASPHQRSAWSPLGVVCRLGRSMPSPASESHARRLNSHELTSPCHYRYALDFHRSRSHGKLIKPCQNQ